MLHIIREGWNHCQKESERKKVKTAMAKVNKEVAADVVGECVNEKSKEINKK